MANRLVVVLLAFCLGLPAAAQSVEEYKFVVHLMNRLQEPSFAQSREYCGFVVRDPRGKITTGAISPGTTASCAPRMPETGTVLASFHTHGGFTHEHWSEIPSVQDVEGDMATGKNGWVATPGGRLWFINGQDGTVRQVCGQGCLKVDPKFIDRPNRRPNAFYTLDKLRQAFGR